LRRGQIALDLVLAFVEQAADARSAIRETIR